ncbi:MAG: STN domain-containing protein [Planctomycetaceae bacterium]|nr:STN domain-containing protein [Planctomycetales bacterium]MCB9939339.1 STN domain-containing protein [Planctomycetaceae bacterium]
MSKNEFDQYLALLSGLLRLSPAQREAIASELRDHLEERLDELLAQGVSRQKAIETALEEFGDATGLAGEFVQIFQRQRRRWMMRMTFGTAVVIAAIALTTSALWPEGQPGPAPGRLIAQNKSKSASDHAPVLSPSLTDADMRTKANLTLRIDVDYLELPFEDVLGDLGEQADLQFHIRAKYLDDNAISTDFPVTISLKDVAAETALELILDQAELKYFVRDGVILVTTEEDAESIAEVRVYNCRDLLQDYVEPFPSAGSVPAAEVTEKTDSLQEEKTTAGKKKKRDTTDEQSSLMWERPEYLAQFGGGGGGMVIPKGPPTREQQLMDIISIAVMPDTWEDVGGPGTIGEFDGMIVIRHNARAHRQVEQVLHMLRDASSQQGWTIPGSRRGFPDPGSPGAVGGMF